MLVPIFACQFPSHIGKLLGQVVSSNPVIAFQHGRYGIHVPFFQFHIPAHFFIPQVVLGAGGSIGALGVDHHLFMERIFVKTGGGGKESRPFLPAAGELGCHMVGHLRVHFSFGWHDFLSSFQFWVNRVGGIQSPSHTTVRAVRHTAVQHNFKACRLLYLTPLWRLLC